ncbi:class I SAM-dependent methyltransferase [Gilliamella sp. B3022]|uniref:class I SAM-dependent methyltransferase n=1 Tax=unclassified Gilliamella TaxID=2685620 RepID=UPI00226AD83B|nr:MULTISPECIES: class I SAM-dependent methyltransferase [unclassified Gilliamella]MCX8656548.1 class I SAM-dependent methyltransferase [Gilliamella sp. B2894]MCX8693140.1 class I SAM-dependent methyltransferase [Gilliamella sp. B2881]WDM18429.1 class I SAM-dependent methyltransferase [Gilliamella sp. B3022]
MNINKPVIDVCCGSRMFYFDKKDDRVLFCDKRKESHILCDRRTLEIKPDIQVDFTNLPFPDETFYQVCFDPPHLVKVGHNSWLAKKYGQLDKSTWQEDLRKGFSECFRVLKTNGTLIFKWNETDIPVKDILALTEYSPLFGHISGKRSNTHWISFIKL